MRVKEERYYDENGKRRPMSTYLYLGESYKTAATWIINGIKYIASFNNIGQCYQFQRDNAMSLIGLKINIEKKHVRRLKTGTYIMDFLTGLPAIDYYTGLPDDMYKARIQKRIELGLSRDATIINLKEKKTRVIQEKYLVGTSGEKIACDIEIKNIDREIAEVKKKPFEVTEWDCKQYTPILAKSDKYDDNTDRMIANLEKLGSDRTEDQNKELARLIKISDDFWDS